MESHQTVVRRGMFNVDRRTQADSRVLWLRHSFRPCITVSGLLSRILSHLRQFRCVSRQLPGPYALTKACGVVVEQVYLPTDSWTPQSKFVPLGQVDDLLVKRFVCAREKRSAAGIHAHETAWRRTLVEIFIGDRRAVPPICTRSGNAADLASKSCVDLRRGEFDVLRHQLARSEGLDLP